MSAYIKGVMQKNRRLIKLSLFGIAVLCLLRIGIFPAALLVYLVACSAEYKSLVKYDQEGRGS